MYHIDTALMRDMQLTVGVTSIDVYMMCDEIDALRAQPANKPLTLDELRRMDGEPVWIVEWDALKQDHDGHWELSTDAEDYFLDRDDCFYGMQKHCGGLHPSGWLACRTKPERSD